MRIVFPEIFQDNIAFAVFLGDISFSSFVFCVWYISIKPVVIESNLEKFRFEWNIFGVRDKT